MLETLHYTYPRVAALTLGIFFVRAGRRGRAGAGTNVLRQNSPCALVRFCYSDGASSSLAEKGTRGE